MLIWKGEDVTNKGIIVEHIPTITKGKKRITVYDVEGRNGFLYLDGGTYEPFALTVGCHFDENVADFDEIKAYLDGYGTLQLQSDRQYTAIINNAIDFEKVAQAHFRKFAISFLVNPIAYATSSTSVSITSSPTTFSISGATAEMQPIITLKGSGDASFTFNNKTFYLSSMNSSLTYKLDCFNKVIVDNNGLNCADQMLYSFPVLQPGTNSVSYSGTLTAFNITYNEAYL